MKSSKSQAVVIISILLIGTLIQVLYDPISSVRHSLLVSSVRSELPQARAKWDSLGISDYTFEIHGISPLICQLKAKIKVRSNLVVQVETLDPFSDDESAQILPSDEWADPDWGEEVFLCSYYHFTMPQILDLVEVTLDNYPSSIIDAEFDPEYGFVTRFEYGLYVGKGLLRPKVSDCCNRLEIKDFQVLGTK